ncbi:phage baseplate upper protein, partial [Lactococcus lactis]
LRAPEDYYTPEDNTPSADNLVQTLYFDSMFQYFGSDELVSGVFMWYFDSNYSLLFEKMLRKYREGTFHA